jgi:predicted HTH domain antitoxin
LPREVLVRVRIPSYYIGDVEREVKLAYAVDLFLRGVVSVERAAELADMNLHDFLVELRRRRIQAYLYSDEELREELEIE